MKKIIAVIPVKLNSKRLKKKNIKLLDNFELFLWTYEAAKKSKFISKVVISTESKEVIKIANRFGYKEKYIRPKKLTKEKYKNTHVLEDVLKDERNYNRVYDLAVILQPTSPIKNQFLIDKSIKGFLKSKANSGMTLRPPIQKRFNFLGKLNQKSKIFNVENYLLKNQKFYIPNGNIYIVKVKEFLSKKTFFIKPIYGQDCSLFESIDIDYLEDFKLAELILKNELVLCSRPSKLK